MLVIAVNLVVNPMPEVAGNYTASPIRGNLDYVFGMRYLGETEDLNTTAIDFEDKTYFDVTVNYQFSDSISFTAGASNILDEDQYIHQVQVLLRVTVIHSQDTLMHLVLMFYQALVTHTKLVFVQLRGSFDPLFLYNSYL